MYLKYSVSNTYSSSRQREIGQNEKMIMEKFERWLDVGCNPPQRKNNNNNKPS
jgi:hypothetical protein